MTVASPSVGYVMTHYPRVATTFISAEITELERLGRIVVPIAMNSAAPEDVTTPEAQEAVKATLYLKALGPAALLAACLAVGARHPFQFVRLGVLAIRSAGSDLKLVTRRLAHLAYAAKVSAYCRARGVDHLHAHFGQAPASIAWFATTISNFDRERRCTWSFTIHGFQDFVNEADARLDLKAGSASFVVCVSDFTKSQLCRVTDPRYWDRFHVVRCGIDLAKFPLRPAKSPDRLPLIIIVARISAEKGHLVLFQAVRQLRDQGSQVRVEIIGSGPYQDQLVQEQHRLDLTEVVTFCGEIPPQEIAGRLAQADVFCLPSFSEGLPVSIMEAMAVGVAVVTTSINGIPELAVDDKTALTVAPSNVAALSAALVRILSDDDRRQRLICGARAAVERDHVVSTNVGRLCRLFDEVQPRGGPRG